LVVWGVVVWGWGWGWGGFFFGVLLGGWVWACVVGGGVVGGWGGVGQSTCWAEKAPKRKGKAQILGKEKKKTEELKTIAKEKEGRTLK